MNIRVKYPSATSAMSAKADLRTWHERFAHVDKAKIKYMIGKNIVKGLDVKDTKEVLPAMAVSWESLPDHRSDQRGKGNAKLASFCTLTCAIQLSSHSPAASILLVVKDEASGYRWTSFLQKKSQAAERIKNFLKTARAETGRQVRRIRTDNGGEYVNEDLKEHLKSEGIIHETSVAHVHEMNGFAERENRTLCEHACAFTPAKGPDTQIMGRSCKDYGNSLQHDPQSFGQGTHTV